MVNKIILLNVGKENREMRAQETAMPVGSSTPTHNNNTLATIYLQPGNQGTGELRRCRIKMGRSHAKTITGGCLAL